MRFGRTHQGRWFTRIAIVATLLALTGIPAWAAYLWVVDDDDGGTINPTNFPVIDIDIEFDKITDQPAAAQINALAAHGTSTGAGIVVAVLDAGFNLTAPMIANNLHAITYDAIDNDWDPNDSGNGIDDDADGYTDPAVGHGTFVAGMVLMAAPDAVIMPIRVADDEGYATSTAIMVGVKYAIGFGADVINLSMKVHEDSQVCDAIAYAERYGVTVVVSGGNDGIVNSDELETLAMQPYVIGVGAVDSTDEVAPFTSMAEDEWMSVWAPGVNLWGPLGEPEDDTVAYWSGTSFSAGIVSGAVALYLDTHTDWDPESVKTALRTNSDPVYREDGIVLPNAGRVDLDRIVD